MNGNFRSPSGNYGRLDRAYGNHDAGQTCPFLPLKSCTVIQGRSNWVEAPLAHLRSAGEVATNPAITLEVDEGAPFSVIAEFSFSANLVQISRDLAGH